MFNNFIIWLPASIVVIYVVYIMGSYFICGNELITINYDYYINNAIREIMNVCPEKIAYQQLELNL